MPGKIFVDDIGRRPIRKTRLITQVWPGHAMERGARGMLLSLRRRQLRHGFEVDVYRGAERGFYFAERSSEYGNIQVDADCFPGAIATVCIALKSQVRTSTRW